MSIFQKIETMKLVEKLKEKDRIKDEENRKYRKEYAKSYKPGKIIDIDPYDYYQDNKSRII